MLNSLKTTLLLSLLTVLMVLVGRAIGAQAGMVIAFLIALAMSFVACWYSDRIVLERHGASEVGEHDHPDFYNMVKALHGVQPATAHMFIVNPLSNESLKKWLSTHPPMEERIARLELLERSL